MRNDKSRGANNKKEDEFLSGAVAVEVCRFRVLRDVMKSMQTSDDATNEIYELRSSPSGRHMVIPRPSPACRRFGTQTSSRRWPTSIIKRDQPAGFVEPSRRCSPTLRTQDRTCSVFCTESSLRLCRYLTGRIERHWHWREAAAACPSRSSLFNMRYFTYLSLERMAGSCEISLRWSRNM